MKTILLLPSTALLTKFYCKSEHAHTVFHGRNRKGGSRMWVISNHSRWERGARAAAPCYHRVAWRDPFMTCRRKAVPTGGNRGPWKPQRCSPCEPFAQTANDRVSSMWPTPIVSGECHKIRVFVHREKPHRAGMMLV